MKKLIKTLQLNFFYEALFLSKLNLIENDNIKTHFLYKDGVLNINYSLLKNYNLAEQLYLLCQEVHHFAWLHHENYPKEILEKEHLKNLWKIACDSFINFYFLKNEPFKNFGKIRFEKTIPFDVIPHLQENRNDFVIYRLPYFQTQLEIYEKLKKDFPFEKEMNETNKTIDFQKDADTLQEDQHFQKDFISYADRVNFLDDLKNSIKDNDFFDYAGKFILNKNINNSQEETVTPINWDKILKNCLKRDCKKIISSNRHFNKKFIHAGTYLYGVNPALKIDNITIAIDISSSLDIEEIKTFIKHVNSLKNVSNKRIIFFNHEIVYDEVNNKENLEDVLKKIGYGGGTDFHKVINSVEKTNHLIFLTDGIYFSKLPEVDYKITWLLSSKPDKESYNFLTGDKIILDKG